jgi:hypothetical protein
MTRVLSIWRCTATLQLEGVCRASRKEAMGMAGQVDRLVRYVCECAMHKKSPVVAGLVLLQG